MRATTCCRAAGRGRDDRRRWPSSSAATRSGPGTRPRRSTRRARSRRRLEALELRFDVKAGPTGSLFGSVTPTDIADKIWDEAKIRVDRRKIDLAEPIKRIGRYEVADRPLRGRHRRSADARRARGRRAAAEEEPEAPAEAETPVEEPVAENIEEPVEPRPSRRAAEEPAAEPVQAAAETAPTGMPEAEPADGVVEEAAAGTLGQTGEPESA